MSAIFFRGRFRMGKEAHLRYNTPASENLRLAAKRLDDELGKKQEIGKRIEEFGQMMDGIERFFEAVVATGQCAQGTAGEPSCRGEQSSKTRRLLCLRASPSNAEEFGRQLKELGNLRNAIVSAAESALLGTT